MVEKLQSEKEVFFQRGKVSGVMQGNRADFEIKFNEPFWEKPDNVFATLHTDNPEMVTLVLLMNSLTNEGIKGRLTRPLPQGMLGMPNFHYEIHWMAFEPMEA